MEKTPKTYGVHPGRRRAYLPSRVDFWDAEERVGCGIAGSTSLCRKMEKEVRGWAKKDWLPRQDQGGLRGGSPFSGPATKSFLHEFQTMILSRTVIFALFARASKMGMRVSARPHRATHAPRPRTRRRPPQVHACMTFRGRARAQAPRTRVWGALFAPRPLPQRILPFLFRGLPWTAVADVVGPVASPHGRK